MRRLRCLVSLAATMLSLLLCLATLIMWPSSYKWDDEGYLVRGEQLFIFKSHGGLLRLVWDTRFPSPGESHWKRSDAAETRDIRFHGGSENGFHGMEWHYKIAPQGGAVVTWRILTVPYWVFL